MKKWLKLGTFLMMACFLTGCGAEGTLNEAKLSKQVTQENETEPITLDWYINFSWFTTPWGGNVVSDEITKKTGVNVNFVTPIGNEEEKLNALIASDSLPDLITLGWWEPQVSEMIHKGQVYALNELADEYDAYFYEVADQTALDWYRQPDGNVYGYPNSSYQPEDVQEHDNVASNQTFLVRKDIYEAIGCPDMTTPEGFMQAVRDAVAAFPEINGEPLIPIGAHVFDETGNVSFDSYLMNFLNIPYEKGGKSYDRHTDPEYIRWLKVFRQLSEEGYLADDIFVDRRTQMNEKLASGRYFCMLYQRTDLADQQKILYSTNPECVYMATDGPKNQNGDDPVLPINGIAGWTLTLISKNCEHPDRAIQFMDYLMSEEGQKIISLGVEGVTYDMVDGKAVIKEEVQDLLMKDRVSYDALYGADDAYWMLQDDAMQLEWAPPLQEPLAQMAEWTYPYATYLCQYDTVFDENTDVGNANQKIQNLWSETIKKLLLAESEEKFDEIFEDFVSTRQELGFEEVMEERTRQMQENKARLGME